jgi:RNA polymerase sigma-70 factor (ECF subfamily)
MTDDAHPSPSTAAEQVQLLFIRYESAIRAFVRALQPAFSEADDVLQETFLTVSRKAESFEPGTNFVAWACGIARLKVLEHYRRQARATALGEAALIALADDAPTEDVTQLREAALGRCLEKIAPKARDLLWRRYNSRQTSEEIAERIGMTSTAVRVALSKARAFLRDCVSTELRKAT